MDIKSCENQIKSIGSEYLKIGYFTTKRRPNLIFFILSISLNFKLNVNLAILTGYDTFHPRNNIFFFILETTGFFSSRLTVMDKEKKDYMVCQQVKLKCLAWKGKSSETTLHFFPVSKVNRSFYRAGTGFFIGNLNSCRNMAC